MQVILRQDYPGLGKVGDTVKVKPGYARNFLIPREIAMIASSSALRQIEIDKKAAEKREGRRIEKAQLLAEFLSHVQLRIGRQSTDDERLYGSVTNADVHEALMARPDVAKFLETQDAEVDRRQIIMDEPLKSLGDHTVAVKLHSDVSANIVIHVVKTDS